MPYKKLVIEKENNSGFGEDRHSVYLDGKKVGEHLRFEEAIEFLKMMEEKENE